MTTDAELARCEREQREILDRGAAGDKPAWLVALGVEDWEMEKRLGDLPFDETLNRIERYYVKKFKR